MADFPTAKTEAVDNVTDVLAKHINNLEDKVGIDYLCFIPILGLDKFIYF